MCNISLKNVKGSGGAKKGYKVRIKQVFGIIYLYKCVGKGGEFLVSMFVRVFSV